MIDRPTDLGHLVKPPPILSLWRPRPPGCAPQASPTNPRGSLPVRSPDASLTQLRGTPPAGRADKPVVIMPDADTLRRVVIGLKNL
jgi:hypothetical protein